MYPQAVLLGLALWRQDLSIWPYARTLSLIGGSISTLHLLEQRFPDLFTLACKPPVPCSVGFGFDPNIVPRFWPMARFCGGALSPPLRQLLRRPNRWLTVAPQRKNHLHHNSSGWAGMEAWRPG